MNGWEIFCVGACLSTTTALLMHWCCPYDSYGIYPPIEDYYLHHGEFSVTRHDVTPIHSPPHPPPTLLVQITIPLDQNSEESEEAEEEPVDLQIEDYFSQPRQRSVTDSPISLGDPEGFEIV